MFYAIRIHKHGGPEVLQWEELEVGEPGPGEIRLKQTAVGIGEHLLHGIDMHTLGCECEKYIAGERAAHVFLRKCA